ncbi:MAG: hypothetical protein FWC16_06420 [Defluviitaleaceae bacterium]|nr:hypothetical protein [Defluviitaleaceae bacterium]MCL2274544.1 hypothetical protein [Defluviitaleaceae bacterium]
MFSIIMGSIALAVAAVMLLFAVMCFAQYEPLFRKHEAQMERDENYNRKKYAIWIGSFMLALGVGNIFFALNWFFTQEVFMWLGILIAYLALYFHFREYGKKGAFEKAYVRGTAILFGIIFGVAFLASGFAFLMDFLN